MSTHSPESRMAQPPHPAVQNAGGPLLQVALEQCYPPEQRIVHDPLAYRFLPGYLKLVVKVGGSNHLRQRLAHVIDSKVPGVRGGVLCRKRAIDDRLAEALGDNLDAVVDLGAGMDTRACRLPPDLSVTFYEVDLPETIAAKAAALRQVCGEAPGHIYLVAADFERQDVGLALRAAGYQPNGKTFFIMEGVSQYIAEGAVRRILEAIRSAAPGSRLAFTYIRRDFLDGRELYGLEMLYRLTRVKRETWRFGLEQEEVAAFIGGYGWREVEQVGSAEYQERYVRPAGRDMPVMAIERLVIAEKA